MDDCNDSNMKMLSTLKYVQNLVLTQEQITDMKSVFHSCYN